MKFEEFTITHITNEFPEVFTLRVKPKKKKKVTPFKSGQFYHIKNPTYENPKETRQFSITTTYKTQTHLEFCIKMYGPWTKALREKQIGENIWLFGPLGGFTFPQATTQAVFLAGGIGITPILSILQSLHEQDATLPVTLIYANKSLHAILKKDYLDQLFQTRQLWKLFHIVSQVQNDDQWNGKKGHITYEFIKNEVIISNQTTFFVCGSENFTNNILSLLRQFQIPENKIKRELFLPARPII